MLASLIASSSGSLGHVQLPMSHRAMAPSTATKNRRTVEDLLLKQKLSVDNHLVLLFDRPAEGNSSDRRSLVQCCLMTPSGASSASVWQNSQAMQDGRIGPLPLIRVADMVGFDETNRPSPSARIEQLLVQKSCVCVSCVCVRRHNMFSNFPLECKERHSLPSTHFGGLLAEHGFSSRGSIGCG